MMKKITMLFVLMFFCIANTSAGQIKKIIFFGDSLTDDGNFYKLSLHLIPKSPPYYKGRFSNGPTWAEKVGNYYKATNNIKYKIYAIGGATAASLKPESSILPFLNLKSEIDKYLLDSFLEKKNRVLYSIWIGGNDYLFQPYADPDKITNTVVNQILSAIHTLRSHGGKNFMIINLPDLSLIPRIHGTPLEAGLREISILHNQKLAIKIQELEQTFPDINFIFFDINDIRNQFTNDPDAFNTKYHTHITNITDACWTGDVWLRRSFNKENIISEIQQSMSNINKPEEFDANLALNMILQNPELTETFQLGQSYTSGNVPCTNPDDHFFWDDIHPSAVAHDVFSQLIIEQLTLANM